ncbi:MAG: hypothetical protein P8X55_10465 [Desulfosarcinaceae bacterium]
MSNLESDILQVATCLNGAVSNTRLYAADHPQVLRYLERAYDQLQRVLKSQSTLTFLVVEDEVIIDNRAVTTRTPQLEQFVQLLKQGAIERLTFSSDVTIQELTQLVGPGRTRRIPPFRLNPGSGWKPWQTCGSILWMN